MVYHHFGIFVLLQFNFNSYARAHILSAAVAYFADPADLLFVDEIYNLSYQINLDHAVRNFIDDNGLTAVIRCFNMVS